MVIIAGQKPGDGAYRWGSWLADVCRPLKRKTGASMIKCFVKTRTMAETRIMAAEI